MRDPGAAWRLFFGWVPAASGRRCFWATLQWDSDRILSVGCAGDGEPPEGRLGPIPVVVLRSRATQRLGKLSLPTWQGLLGTLVRLVRTGGCGWNYAPQPRRTSPGSERDD